MSFVNSTRGRRKFVYKNHVYVFSKTTKDAEYSIWVCEKRTTCKGRIWTRRDSPTVYKTVNEHCHSAQAARHEVLAAVDDMKIRARNTGGNPQEIIATSVNECHTNVAALLPRKESLKRSIRKIRNQHGMPPLPNNLEDLDFPQSFKEVTIDGRTETFLIYDSERRLLPQRFLIFSTRNNMAMLARSEEWFVDGTFSTCPTLFKQLYTIHVKLNDSIIPVVYALLPNKTQLAYSKVIEELRQLQHGLNPRTVMMDFEMAAINAFKEGFANVQIKGCFFHLHQSVWRKVQSEGLKALYEADHNFAKWIKMIPAVAFVPINDVEYAFDALTEDPNFPQQAMPVADYFEDTYIGRRGRRNRRPPVFAAEIWNVYESTINNEQRTNNNVEGWHRGFQAACGGLYPNIFKFVNVLKKQQSLHNYEVAQMLAGQPPPRRNTKYEVISNRLQRLAANYNRDNIIEYLQGISYNYDL